MVGFRQIFHSVILGFTWKIAPKRPWVHLSCVGISEDTVSSTQPGAWLLEGPGLRSFRAAGGRVAEENGDQESKGPAGGLCEQGPCSETRDGVPPTLPPAVGSALTTVEIYTLVERVFSPREPLCSSVF